MREFYNRHPLLVILLSAFILRIAAAFYNFTPTAEDDYANIIEPALKHYQTGEKITIEAYRLPILPKAFYAFISPLKLFSVTDARFIVSWGLAVLGIISLFGVWGSYRLTENFLPGKYKEFGGWLYAAHFILPFYSTRAFQESLTLTTMPCALYLITKFFAPQLNHESQAKPETQKRMFNDFFWGAFLIGLTVIFRFQVAILAVTIFVFLLVYWRKKTLGAPAIIGYAAGGLAAFVLLLALDMVEARPMLSTPLEYFRINYEGNIASESYGSAPWYTYVTLLAVVFIPPMSFVFLWPFFSAAKKNIFLSVNLMLFVFIHSLIGNKLERFMLPVLPIFFLLTLQGIYLFRENRLIKISVKAFALVNIIIMVPIIFSRSQLNIINAAGYLSNSKHILVLYRIDLWKQGYMTFNKPYPPSFSNLQNLNTHLNTINANTLQILSLGVLNETEFSAIKALGFSCKIENEFQPSWQERLVIQMNPKFNARRDTSVLYLCEKINLK